MSETKPLTRGAKSQLRGLDRYTTKLKQYFTRNDDFLRLRSPEMFEDPSVAQLNFAAIALRDAIIRKGDVLTADDASAEGCAYWAGTAVFSESVQECLSLLVPEGILSRQFKSTKIFKKLCPELVKLKKQIDDQRRKKMEKQRKKKQKKILCRTSPDGSNGKFKKVRIPPPPSTDENSNFETFTIPLIPTR